VLGREQLALVLIHPEAWRQSILNSLAESHHNEMQVLLTTEPATKQRADEAQEDVEVWYRLRQDPADGPQ